jgi:ATP-binding cassette subfamily B (MDR/TAP) protein 1
VKDADQIYVMGNGVFLEQGTHEELLRDFEGPYARLVAAQKLREAREADEIPAQSSLAGSHSHTDFELAARKENPLGRRDTGHSLASQVIAKKEADAASGEHDKKDYTLLYLFRRMGRINKDAWRLYVYGVLGAIGTGSIYPVFGIVYAQAVVAFQTIPNSEENRRQIRHDGDRNALWFFIISIGATATITIQNYFFTNSAAILTGKLRSLGFRAILRQDSESISLTPSIFVILIIISRILRSGQEQRK